MDNNEPWVLQRKTSVQWNPANDCWIDIVEFDRLSEEIDTADRAVDLYTGDLLPEIYDDWLEFDRKRLRNQHLANLSDLAEHNRISGDLSSALEYNLNILEFDPWREDVIREMMLLKDAGGDRAGALRLYQEFKTRLFEELAIRPMPETEILRDRIRSYEPSLPPSQRAAIRSRISPISPPTTDLVGFPADPNPFVGRIAELNLISQKLADPEVRLLTILGSGGIGKTRLAVQAVRQLQGKTARFEDRIYFFSLAGVSEPDRVAAQLARGLLGGVLTEKISPEVQVLDYLRNKKALIVLDSLEHLAGGLPVLPAILAQAPGVTVLATSRQPLNLQSESRLLLEGLEYPQTQGDEAPASFSAVQLFDQVSERVAAGKVFSAEDYREIHAICRLVQGMPLAIEMAARWIRLYEPREVARQIAAGLDFLATSAADVPDRHQSIRAVFSHSWELLDEKLRRILCALSVFGSSFTLEAALAVADASALDLASLFDRSLLVRRPARSYSLHELLRLFVVDKREPSETETAKDRHTRYHLNLLAARSYALQSGNSRRPLQEIDQELANIRQAWEHALTVGNWVAIDRAMDGLFTYYGSRGNIEEGLVLLKRAHEKAQKARPSIPAPTVRRLAVRRGNLLFRSGDSEAGIRWMEAGLDTEQSDERAFVLNRLSAAFLVVGRNEEAAKLLKEALAAATRNDNRIGRIEALTVLGRMRYDTSHYEDALESYEQALLETRQFGTDRLLGRCLHGLVHYQLGNYSESRRYLDRARQAYRDFGDREGETSALNQFVAVAHKVGDFQSAQGYYDQSLAINRDRGNTQGEAISLVGLANILHEEGYYEGAIDHHQRSLAILERRDHRHGIAIALGNLGNVWRDLGDFEKALAHHQDSLEIKRQLGMVVGEATTLANLGVTFDLMGDNETGRKILEQALALMEGSGQQDLLGSIYQDLGFAYLTGGNHAQAERFFLQSLEVRRLLDQANHLAEPLCGLAQYHLVLGDLNAALAPVEELLTLMDSGDLDRSFQPFRSYLACYQVLAALEDPRMDALLDRAHKQLLRRADKISSQSARLNFLENMPAHREIMALRRGTA